MAGAGKFHFPKYKKNMKLKTSISWNIYILCIFRAQKVPSWNIRSSILLKYKKTFFLRKYKKIIEVFSEWIFFWKKYKKFFQGKILRVAACECPS